MVGDVVLTQSIAIEGVGFNGRGVASNGRSLAMSLEFSVRDVGEVTVGARLAPELAVGVG